VFLSVTAGSARAAEQQQTPPPPPPLNLRGVYGGIGAGFGVTDGDATWAWRMMAWWRPIDYLSGEIGYADVDQDDGDFDGLYVGLDPTFPIRAANLDVYGRIGGFFNEDNHFALGLGAAYHLPKNFGLRFDWDRLNVEGEGGKGVDIVTFSLFYHLAKQGK
jgi:hypothetical protein